MTRPGPRRRDLAVALAALLLFCTILRLIFDTPWNRMLIGFLLAIAWFAVAGLAWRLGVPLVPRSVAGAAVQQRRDRDLRWLVGPIWIGLTAIWLTAGWFVTNGGG